MKIRNTLLIGLAVLHFPAANLIIASSSSTTSGSDQPDQYHSAARLLLAELGMPIPEPADPMASLHAPNGADISQEKYCDCFINSPYCLMCHPDEPKNSTPALTSSSTTTSSSDQSAQLMELEAMLAQNEALLSQLQQHNRTDFLSELYLGSTPHEASFFNELYSRLGQAISGTLNRR